MSTAWLVSPTWDRFVIAGVLVVASVLVFWLSYTGYEYRYFTGKALKLALLRTVGWLVMYGGTFVLIFALLSRVWPAGWLRYVIGGGVWWLLTETVLALGWQWLNRLLEAW